MEIILEYLKSVLFGIVQGITEWLPISSTGHLILLNQFTPLTVAADPARNQEFFDMFKVLIQLGSILAVVVLYFHKLNPFSPKKTEREKKNTFSLWGKVLVASVPAGIIGILFNDVIDSVLSTPYVIAATLIVYGVLFLILENRNKQPKVKKFSELTYQMALLIGVCQMLALIPGTSRSGATILGAVFLGCSRFVAAEFSFFLAIPAMLGASGVKILIFLVEGGGFSGSELGILLVGMVISFIVSMLAIRFLMGFIKKHDFKAFGWYRIVLGIVVVLYFALSGAQMMPV